jgi:nicotinate phosphoribosyltransferase
MSVFDNKRLDPRIFDFDYKKAAKGYYTDKYFENGRKILEILSSTGYRTNFREKDLDIGSLFVEMQIFHRREPFAIIANTDFALAILAACSGRFEAEKFINTADRLEILSLSDGEIAVPWQPVMKIRGVYRDFALLETLYLGALTRGTRIATNTYNILKAANGKGVLFFPARFDLPATQESDGYAYYIGLQKYNQDFNRDIKPLVSTDAQGAWWGGRGGGTVAHAYIICHLKDSAEAMINFARHLPPDIPRIALVDTNNDCVGDSLKTAGILFKEYLRLTEKGEIEEAAKYKLFGVRCDTSSNMIDKSLEAVGDPQMDYGVNPRLVRALRDALNSGWKDLNIKEKDYNIARDYYTSINIVASGGFDIGKVEFFERQGAPVDLYGVGSYFFSGETNDFTADIVRVNAGGEWIELAKDGRHSINNNALKPVTLKNGRIEEG